MKKTKSIRKPKKLTKEDFKKVIDHADAFLIITLQKDGAEVCYSDYNMSGMQLIGSLEVVKYKIAHKHMVKK